MKQKDKFLLLMVLSCLPLGNAVAEQTGAGLYSPINQEVLQNTVKITGQVIDPNGEPIIGATVMEKGTTNGIVTDLDGNFSLTVFPSHKLQISYVGFQTQELNIGSNRSFKIVLKEDTELLDEVVVVGYGSVKKSDLTGAVASVSTQDLIRSGRTDAVGAMQGALPGVQIQRSNSKPGGEYNILIRGLNTISGSTSPLIVVDGVPGASLSNLNPDDIEKIDILKDDEDDVPYQGCMAIDAGDRNRVKNILFEDIRVESIQEGKLFHINIRFNPKYDKQPGQSIDGVTFRNITYNGVGENPSLIKGLDKERMVRNITFENVVVNGKKIKDLKGFITNEYIEGIKIK